MDTEEKLYEEVKSLVGEVKDEDYIDHNFDESLYNIGVSAKRTATHLRWINGKSIHLGDLDESEIKFMQNLPHDMALEWGK